MARQLFPHDKLGDEYYWVVVESIDKDMAGSPELKTRIQDGLVQLNQAAGGDFSAAGADKQVEAMKKLEDTPFFSDMLNTTQFYFYNNKTVWPKFGYDGSSWEKGGYINCGFNTSPDRWPSGARLNQRAQPPGRSRIQSGAAGCGIPVNALSQEGRRHGCKIRTKRCKRRRGDRLGCRRRDPFQRAVPEGRQGGLPGGGEPPDAGGLRQ